MTQHSGYPTTSTSGGKTVKKVIDVREGNSEENGIVSGQEKVEMRDGRLYENDGERNATKIKIKTKKINRDFDANEE